MVVRANRRMQRDAALRLTVSARRSERMVAHVGGRQKPVAPQIRALIGAQRSMCRQLPHPEGGIDGMLQLRLRQRIIDEPLTDRDAEALLAACDDFRREQALCDTT